MIPIACKQILLDISVKVTYYLFCDLQGREADPGRERRNRTD